MAKILLLSPPSGRVYGEIGFKTKRIGVPPIGLAGLASFLKEKEHKVRLIDLTYFDGGWNEFEDILVNEKPAFVGLTCTTPQVRNTYLIAGLIKRKLPHVRVVVGGPHVSALPEQTLRECSDIDMVVCGVGEETMAEIASGRELIEIDGLAFRKDDKIVNTEKRRGIKDLDALPFPLYEQLPLKYYGHPIMGRSMGLMSGRGCPYECTFCASNVVHSRGYHTRSAANMIEEIELLRKHYGFNVFSFWDDTFTFRKDRIFEFCNLVLQKDLRINWSCSTRVDSCSKEMLQIMKKAGCSMLFIGFESGNEDVLKRSKKRITLDQSEYFCRLAAEEQIPICGYFILGLPYDTKSTIVQTIEFAIKLKIDFAQFAVLMPLPGTATWEMGAKGEGLKILSSNWDEFGRYQRPVIELPDMSADQLFKYYKKAYLKFYVRPSYFWQRVCRMNSLSDLKWLARNTRLFIDFYHGN